MNSAITRRRTLHRVTVPLACILLVTVLCVLTISSPASAQTVPDASESTPTPAVAQMPRLGEPDNDRSLLPLGIGIVVIALATYLVWGATFLVVLDKSSPGRLGGR